uniref:Uncharacterized protein n=1 Tax=Sipha flava TaxID=143950 RepID=A0A2S2Q1U1_9HEMI
MLWVGRGLVLLSTPPLNVVYNRWCIINVWRNADKYRRNHYFVTCSCDALTRMSTQLLQYRDGVTIRHRITRECCTCGWTRRDEGSNSVRVVSKRARRIKSHPRQDYNSKSQNNLYLKIDENKIKYHRNRYSGDFIILSDM